MTNQRDIRWVWTASEILLVATSIASVLMLQRVFDDTSFRAPLIFTLLVGHGALIAMRWTGFDTAISALVSLVATSAATVAIHYSDTAIMAVLPTSSSVDQFSADLRQAGEVFNAMQAPVPAITGFLVIASIATWFIAFAADWAAFRLLAPGQALIPFVAMVVFVALLGTDTNRLGSTGIALTSGVLFLLAHRSAERASDGIWLDRGPGRGYLSLMAAGAVVAIVAAVIGVLGGPAVPGADEAPLVEIGDDGRRENRPLEVISPLVQIQPRLIDQSDQVLFTVETTQRAYWRIAALDVFDGSLWRSQGSFRSANDALPVDYPSGAPVDTVIQTFDLGELNVVWAPAAYLPTKFENLSTAGVNYESESATFIVDTNDQRVSDGLRYLVESKVPTFTGPMLTRLAMSSNDRVDARYLDLPGDYSPLARATAEQITAGSDDPYTQALALQNYFRDNFAYDIDVAKGHDIERLEDFLTIQRGYCEQFAGTYASMARSIGLPARVATGFTPGDPDPDNPNRYIVRGRHAHAWPEVFISGAGWVAFEPTPGRGAPNATEYTGVPEAQDSFTSPVDETEEAAGEEAAAQDAAPTPTPVPFEPDELEPQVDESLDAVLPESESSASPALLVALAILAVAILWGAGVPALKRWREKRRLLRVGQNPRRRVTLAWATTADDLELHGQPPFETETLEEYAERIEWALPQVGAAFTELTSLAVEAAYKAAPPTDRQADQAERLARQVRHVLMSQLSWPSRGVREVDPRPLISLSDSVADRAERLAGGATSAH